MWAPAKNPLASMQLGGRIQSWGAGARAAPGDRHPLSTQDLSLEQQEEKGFHPAPGRTGSPRWDPRRGRGRHKRRRRQDRGPGWAHG